LNFTLLSASITNSPPEGIQVLWTLNRDQWKIKEQQQNQRLYRTSETVTVTRCQLGSVKSRQMTINKSGKTLICK